MKLFHFCANHMLPGIQREGLTKGRICWIEDGSVRMISGVQWLTSNPNRNEQEWCNPEYSSLPYDRCANRITVCIPKSARANLRRWVDAGPLLVPLDQYQILTAYGDPDSYMIYCGNIPAGWIRSVEQLGARWERRRSA